MTDAERRKRDLLTGYLMGLAGMPRPVVTLEREPVAWEILWDGEPEADGGLNGDNGDYFWLWYSSEDNENRLSEGDVVRVTVDGTVCNLTVQIMPPHTAGFVEAGNRWLYQGSYPDEGGNVYFWEYGGALRFFTRAYYWDKMPHVKFERAIATYE